MKVLLTGNIFHNYEHSIGRAFRNLGHEVNLHFFNFEGPFYPTQKTIYWLKYGFLPQKLGIDFFYKRDVDKFNETLKLKLSNGGYDLVLVIKGLTINEDVFDNFSGVRILWVLDSIKRFKSVQSYLNAFDLVYSYEPSDVAFCEDQLGVNISCLPVAFDENWYKPLKAQRNFEVSFVGGGKPNREVFINEISKHTSLTLIGDFYKSQYLVLRNSTIRKTADHSTINKLYNESYFNLNIHKPQSIQGVNPRFFEILGAGGGVQFVEQKPLVSDFIDGKHLIYYSSIEECLDKMYFYMGRSYLIKQISIAGYLKALNSHTWTHRVSKMLTDANAI